MFSKELPSVEILSKISECYPDIDVKAYVTWMQIVHASTILQRRIDRELNKENLSYGHFIILLILASVCAKVPIRSLTDMLGVAPDTISSVVASMQCDGLIRPSTTPKDRCVGCIELTQEGRVTIDKIAPLFFENQSEAMSGLAEDELHSLFLLLSKVKSED